MAKKSALPKPPKLKKLKAAKLGSKIKGLVKSGRISTKALGKMSKLRGSQIAIGAPRGGVGKGMAGM